MYEYNQGEILLQNGYTRMGCSSNIEIYYEWKCFENLWYDTKEYLNVLFWGSESLYEVESIVKERYKYDSFINLIAFDRYTNEVLIYLDPIGTKSLYINDRNLISPSIESLRNQDSKLDYQYLGLIRKFGYNQNELTPYVNIKRLLPWFIYKWNQLKLWNKLTAIRLYTKVNTEFMLPLYLTESIENRLKSIDDKVIGILLSGWLDSSIISALVLKANKDLDHPKRIRFFTTENEEDLKYAKEVADMLKIELEIIPWEDVELNDWDLFMANETPIDLGSTVPNIKLFKRISSMWIKTIITGDWPDEMFRWYKRNAEDFDYHMHDMLNELVFYHFPRLEKAARYYGINLITPYVTPQIWNMALSHDVKIYKGDLKDFAHWLIPESVIERVKEPLKNKELREDKKLYQEKFLNRFISYANKTWEFTQTIKK